MCNADKLILSICLISVLKCASDGGDHSCLFATADDSNCVSSNKTDETEYANELQDVRDASGSRTNVETSTVLGKQLLELHDGQQKI